MLERGMRAPDFVAENVDGVPTRFYSKVGGRPVVLSFGRRVGVPDGCDTVAVLVEEEAGADGIVFVDREGEVCRQYGGAGGVILLLDANLRVVALFDAGQGDVEAAVEESVRSLPSERALEVGEIAPILTVPRVLEPEPCRFLIDVWNKKGHVETGVESSRDGKRADAVSVTQKRRADHTVEDPKLVSLLTQTLGRRLLPEIERAFGAKVPRFEGFKVACYDAASSGFFDAHRDNLSPATAHRQFAVSLNLNEDFEGGQLVFPEFGPHRFRPPAGGALIFSCSHLHAVLPVRRGRRFALLTFLYAEDRTRASSPSRTLDPFSAAAGKNGDPDA